MIRSLLLLVKLLVLGSLLNRRVLILMNHCLQCHLVLVQLCRKTSRKLSLLLLQHLLLNLVLLHQLGDLLLLL